MSLWRRVLSGMNPPVFFGAAATVIAFVVFGGGWSKLAQRIFGDAQAFIADSFGWYYLLLTAGLLVFVGWIAFSRVGRIRLGQPDDTPEHSTWGWLAMLFAAGMGTGLVFWSVAEPLSHYGQPPVGPAETETARQVALRYTFFHWGLHPWAIYIVIGLAMAFLHFRHELPLAPRSLLYPLLKERIYGPIGHVVDVISTVGTLFGVATSLGLGAMQLNVGLGELFGVESQVGVQLALIAGITAVATVSVVSGISAGIRRLSMINMVLAFALLAFVLFAGPTRYIAQTFVDGLGAYIQNLPQMSLRTTPGEDGGWQAKWTLFYWGWWISWCPFVGIFTARISRGRTVREYVVAVLLVPATLTFLWLAVFGGAGLHAALEAGADIASVVQDRPALGLYALLETLPGAKVSSALATLVVIFFFITSSDSGSLVDDMVTSGGHPNPPKAQRVFWAVSEGAVAATLLVTGGLEALQTASIAAGLPMSVFLIFAAIGLYRGLRADVEVEGVPDVEVLAGRERA